MAKFKNNDYSESNSSKSEIEESSSTSRSKNLLKKFIDEETKFANG